MDNNFNLTPETPEINNTPSENELCSIKYRFSQLGFSYLFYVFGSQILASFIIIAVGPFVALPSEIFDAVVFALTPYVFAAPALYFFIKEYKAEPPTKESFSAGDFTVAFFVCIAIMSLGSIAGNICGGILENLLGYPLTNTVSEMLSGPAFWINTIYASFIAPVGEELVWRKFILDRTHRYGATMAIVFSSLFFALMHASLDQFFYAFGVGVFFGYIYLKTGKISITIALHALLNLCCGVIPSILFGNLDLDAMEEAMGDPDMWAQFSEANSELIVRYSAYSAILNSTLVIGLILFFVFRKRLTLDKRENELPKELRGNTAYFNPGVITFILCTAGLWLLSVIMMSPAFAQG